MSSHLNLPSPLDKAGFWGWYAIEPLSQGRIFEVCHRLFESPIRNTLPKVPDPEGKSLSEWIDSLTPLEIQTVKQSWLADVRGYV